MMNILNRQWQDLLLPGPSFKLRGRISVDVLDARSGIILRHYGPKPNMILNVGKDMPFSYKFARCFLYGHLSTDTGTPAATDSTMAGWVKQTNTYGSGDGVTSASADTITLTRSFVFAAETGDVTYTKFYSSPTSGSSASPFNEVLFATPITLASGQQAKVTMSLLLTITPHETAATYSSDIISGISGSTGSFRVISARSLGPYYYMAIIDSAGAVVDTCWATGGFLEPSYAAEGNCEMDASSQSTLSSVVNLISAVGAYSGVIVSYFSPSITLGSYTAGSYARTKTILADLANMNGSGIQSLFVGCGTSSPCWQLLLDTTFSKLNTQKLTLNIVSTIS